MSNDREIMIELQNFWNMVLQLEAEAERSRRSITLWQNRNRELTAATAKADNEHKNLNLRLKQDELDLASIEARITKTEARKDLLKSERELEAVNSELDKLRSDKDSLETSIFTMMEQADLLKAGLDEKKKELAESDEQTAKDIDGLKGKIESLTAEALDYRNKFDGLKTSLSPAVRSRFEKLINSKDGVAIARLNGETCTHCNFQVPPSLAAGLRNTGYTNCTNCGRFVY